VAQVRVERLTKHFDGMVAVASLDLEVADGEFLVLLGPSGCGKTTTLRCIAGLETPTSGEVWIGSRRVTHLRAADRDIAFVFQFYALYPHLTVYDNIAFPLRATGLAREEIHRRVLAVAELLRIPHLLKFRPAQLSGGEQQRVALGRAIVRRPQAFLMDEPLTNVDASFRVDLRVELKHLQQELGTTTIYVTHDQTEAMSLGHRIAVMRSGVLQQVGTPLEVYRSPKTLFVASFIGSPPMNLIPVDLEDHLLRGQDLQVPCPPTLPMGAPRHLVLGVRPEDVSFVDSQDAHAYGTILTREPLGDETVYAVAVGDQVVRVVTEPHVRWEPGTNAALAFSLERLHLYDPVTGALVL